MVTLSKDVRLPRGTTPRYPPMCPSSVAVWTPIYVVGCPLGSDPIPTSGAISSLHQDVGGLNHWMVDAPAFFGNSGGAVFLAETRELCGVFAKICTFRDEPVSHMGLITPITAIRDWLADEDLDHCAERVPIAVHGPSGGFLPRLTVAGKRKRRFRGPPTGRDSVGVAGRNHPGADMNIKTTLRDLPLASTLLLPALAALVALTTLTTLPAQSVSLVRDINDTPLRTLSANPSAMVACGDYLYMTADVQTTRELHEVHHATGADRRLGSVEGVRKLTAGSARLYFVGRLPGATRDGLWLLDRCDGTGTPRAIAWFDAITNVAVVGDDAFFTASTSTRGFELWRFDATSGTSLVEDIRPGSASSSPQKLVAMGSILMFTADDGTNGRELWRSDGSPSGTYMVRDIRVGSGSSSPSDLTPSYDRTNDRWRLYFSANNYNEGREPWVSDGSLSGTFMIADLNPGFARSSNPDVVAGSGGGAYFAAYAPTTGRELYFTLGTAVTTRLVEDIRPGSASSNPRELISYGWTVFFVADDGLRGAEPWRSNGTPAGTYMLGDVVQGPAGSSPTGLYAFPEFMSASLYFVADAGGGRDLYYWRDGTGRPVPIDLVGAAPDHLTVLPSGKIAFAADDVRDNRYGREVWIGHGIARQFEMLADINDLPDGPETFDSSPAWGLPFFGSLLFAATDETHGHELWISDGTEPGTRLLKDIAPTSRGTTGSVPRHLTLAGGQVFFVASDGTGDRLFKTDGTTDGTIPIGPPAFVAWIAPVGERVFLSSSDPARGSELWVSDGTAAGTTIVRNIRPGSVGSAPSDPTPLGDRLFFTADDGVRGREVWVSDGTFAGTTIVRDIRPGAAGATPVGLAAFGERVFFTADDGVRGRELWSSDGTAGGTSLITEIAPGAASANPDRITAIGDRLFFTADDGARGRELWVSDGTAAGTTLAADLNPGPGDTRFRQLVGVGERCFCAISDAQAVWLWVSDGTRAGTRRVQAPFNGVEQSVAAGSRRLWFRGHTTAAGWQLWSSDGTDAGTRRETRIGSVPQNDWPLILGIVDGEVLFAARHQSLGEELFKVSYGPSAQQAMSQVVGQGRGAGNRVPSLRVEDPVLGGVFTATVRNAVPGGLAWLLLSLPPTGATSLGSDYVAYVDFARVGILGPFPSPGSKWSMLLPAPDVPAVRGLGLAWQVITAPSSGPNGYDLTNGVFTTHGL